MQPRWLWSGVDWDGWTLESASSTSIARLAKLVTPSFVYAAQARWTYSLPLRAPRGRECEDPTFVSGYGSTASLEER